MKLCRSRLGGLRRCRLLPSMEVFRGSVKVRAEWSVRAGSEGSVTKTEEEVATEVFVRVRKDILIRLWILIGIPMLACSASGALSVDEQVKMLAERYRQVEDQLARSIRYTSKDESGGATTVRQEWYNGAEDLIKATVERNDASGRELTEYIPHDLGSDFGWRGLFLLTRKETPAPDGGMQVEESRKYFGETEEGNGQLIRELRKSARFKSGEPTDTVHVPNMVVDLSKQNKAEGGAEEFGLGEPHELSPALRKVGPPQFFDPFANVQGDSAKYRVIHGSVAPDGRFAIAMALPPEQSNWDALHEDENYFYENGARDYELPNYIIDLAEKKLLAKQVAITLERSAVTITNNVSLGGHLTRLSLCSSGTTNGALPSAWRGRSVQAQSLPAQWTWTKRSERRLTPLLKSVPIRRMVAPANYLSKSIKLATMAQSIWRRRSNAALATAGAKQSLR